MQNVYVRDDRECGAARAAGPVERHDGADAVRGALSARLPRFYRRVCRCAWCCLRHSHGTAASAVVRWHARKGRYREEVAAQERGSIVRAAIRSMVRRRRSVQQTRATCHMYVACTYVAHARR